jgi:tetratricopeptide (TPR) repeat protein
MLGTHEAQLCYFLARDTFRGAGAIVDAGSFLGKSAYFFAQGLLANPRYVPNLHRIHCFDNFRVNEGATIQFIREKLDRIVALGDSTRGFFDSQVAPVSSMLEIHAGDFHTLPWPRQPIEILLVDIAKSERLGRRVAEIFFPELIPGEAIVIQQDYHHPWLPHIHVTMEYLADYFDPIVTRVDDSAVFLYRDAIPAHILQRAVDYDFSYEERLVLMDRAIARLPEEDRFYVQLARIVLQFRKTSVSALRDELTQLHRRFLESGLDYSANPYFEEVAAGLDELEQDLAYTQDEQEGWRCNDAGSYARCLELADKLLKQRPTTYNMTMRGSALLGLGRCIEAEEQFRAALEVRPPSGYAYIGLAWALHGQNRSVEAETELLRGLRDRDAGVPSKSYLEQLTWFWCENPPAEKLPSVAALQREFPGDPEVWVLDAWLRGRGGDHCGAEASIERAARLGLTPERLDEVRQEMPLHAAGVR